jgi:hypothetical protein
MCGGKGGMNGGGRRTASSTCTRPPMRYVVLVESVRVNGKPRQRHVAYLGSYHSEPDGILPHWRNGPDLHYRVWW